MCVLVMETLLKKRCFLSSQMKVLEQSVSEPAELTQEHLLEYHGQAVALRKENVDLPDPIYIKSSDESYDQHEQQFCELAEIIDKLKVALDGFFTWYADGSLMNVTMPVLYPGLFKGSNAY